MIKFNSEQYATKSLAAFALKELIHRSIEELNTPIKQKLLAATTARDSARYGGELSVLRAVHCLLTEIKIV